MKGIVGRKLGMTRVFDPETGAVTPVTVVEAGPCPVVAVRTPETDGYEAVQIAYDPVAERKLTKAEAGHLGKNGVAPHRAGRAILSVPRSSADKSHVVCTDVSRTTRRVCPPLRRSCPPFSSRAPFRELRALR